MSIEQAIEIIKNNFEDSRGTIIFRDEWQAVDTIEEYIKNSISKDKIKEILADVIFTLSLASLSNETKFYIAGVKNSLEDLLKENNNVNTDTL